MAILIGAVLFMSLIYSLTYRNLRGPGPRKAGTHNPILQRWLQLDTGDSDRDSAAEAREADLSRQLCSGDLDADAYRQAMTDLTQHDAAHTDELN